MSRRRIILNAPPPVAGARSRTIEVGGESRELLPFEPVRGEVLTWTQPRFGRAVYWLESSRGTHLLLHIPGHWVRMPRDCPVESVNGSWSIHMGWALFAHTMPLHDREGTELMRHVPGFFNGRVQFPDGAMLRWRRVWRAHELRDAATPEAEPLITLSSAFAWFRDQATVTLSDAARSRADLLPLLALTWLAHIDSRRHRHYV